MKHRLILSLIIVIFLLLIIAMGCTPADIIEGPGANGDEKPVITIGLPPYASDWPACYIVKYVTEDLAMKQDS